MPKGRSVLDKEADSPRHHRAARNWAVTVQVRRDRRLRACTVGQPDNVHGVQTISCISMFGGASLLEWIIVTPRYHHIHHSDKPEHYNSNLAVLFSIWDHLFGTYFDPEKVGKNLTFGIGESVHPVRLVVGL